MSKSTLDSLILKKKLFNAFRRKRLWVSLTLNGLETVREDYFLQLGRRAGSFSEQRLVIEATKTFVHFQRPWKQKLFAKTRELKLKSVFVLALLIFFKFDFDQPSRVFAQR